MSTIHRNKDSIEEKENSLFFLVDQITLDRIDSWLIKWYIGIIFHKCDYLFSIVNDGKNLWSVYFMILYSSIQFIVESFAWNSIFTNIFYWLTLKTFQTSFFDFIFFVYHQILNFYTGYSFQFIFIIRMMFLSIKISKFPFYKNHSERWNLFYKLFKG